MNSATIYCQYCHQRLFDILPGTRGSVEIKCSRCRRIVKITFRKPETPQASHNFIPTT
ncbi:MAG: hypothetical protein HFG75_04450 [Hungatella sp.]|nr:hypothetical protein [Hungatella sp.]